MRTIVELPEEQILALKQLTDDTQLSRAELMRRAVAEYISKHTKNTEDVAFGLRKNNIIDGLKYQNDLRNEWTDESVI